MRFVLENSVVMRWLFKDGGDERLAYAARVLELLTQDTGEAVVPGAWCLVPGVWKLEAGSWKFPTCLSKPRQGVWCQRRAPLLSLVCWEKWPSPWTQAPPQGLWAIACNWRGASSCRLTMSRISNWHCVKACLWRRWMPIYKSAMMLVGGTVAAS